MGSTISSLHRNTTRIKVFIILLLSISFKLLAQDVEKVEFESYKFLTKGIYVTKSEDVNFIWSNSQTIEPLVLLDTTLLSTSQCMYLANESPIVLFKNMNPTKEDDVAGVLKTSTLVQVDTVYYNHVYIDSPDAPMSFEKWYQYQDNDSTYYKYKLTYDVWYAIVINGIKYYTDYKLNDYINYINIPSRKQILVVASESTGYDGIYDRGYPDNDVALILEKTPLGWKQIYRSEKLHINDDDEYGIFGQLMFKTIDKKECFEINFLSGEDIFSKMIWDGASIRYKKN